MKPRLALILVLFWATPIAQSQAGPAARHVILLSLDGARSDAMRAALPPALVARGAVSWVAQTTFPSSTLSSHASMLSGVPPAVHGVTFNDWRMGGPAFRRTTVLGEVRRAGGRAAALVHKPKLLMPVPDGAGVSGRYLPYPRYRQADVVEVAARLFVEGRPHLLFVHVADPDAVGHEHGWMSERYLRVIAGVPALIERLLRALDEAGLADRGLVVVTADHGGHRTTHGTRRAEDMTIPWMAFGGAARPGVVVGQPVVVHDTAATILAALGVPAPADWQGRPVAEALLGR